MSGERSDGSGPDTVEGGAARSDGDVSTSDANDTTLRTAEPETATADAHQDDHHEDEGGSSFAGRMLMWLILLIVGAGVGIWGAPRVAPMLPSGMAPVAEWLTPGAADTEARIAEIESAFESRIATLDEEVASAAGTAAEAAAGVEDQVAAAISQAEERLGSEIAAVRDEITPESDAGLLQRMGRLESTIEGQVAEVQDLKDQISSVPATAELTEDAVARIDLYRTELEGLRGEMGSLSDQVAGLSDQVSALLGRVEGAESRAEREVTQAQERVAEIEEEATRTATMAEIRQDMARIDAALASGAAFTEPVERLQSSQVAVPEGLAAAAPSGVRSFTDLRDSFGDAAHDAIRASIRETSGGDFLSRAASFVEAQIASRSLAPQEGLGPDAILSRMEEALRAEDLDAALAEAGDLPDAAAAAMSDWLDAARLRANAEDGFSALSADLSATN